MLIATRNKLADDILVKQRLQEDGTEAKKEDMIAAQYGELAFHSGGQVADNGLQREDVYVHLCNHSVKGPEK